MIFCPEARFDMQDEMASQHEEKISQILQQTETHRSKPVSVKRPLCIALRTDELNVDTDRDRESSA